MGSALRITFQLLAILLVFDQSHQCEISDRNSQKTTVWSDTNFVHQSSDFAIELYKQVSAQARDGNVVFSPLSISASLSLAAMGAGGETADEMFGGLRYGDKEQKQQVARWYGRLMDRLANDTSIVLANKLYVKEGCNVKRSFQQVATASFKSEVKEINFAQSQIAAKTINDWVERKTNNKIKNLISPDSLDALTSMVLVNAVHFHAKWKHQFKSVNTRPMPFWTSETESRKVPMMFIREKFAYKNFKSHGFSALELSCSDSNVKMLVLLPNNRDGLAALEERLPKTRKSLLIDLHNQLKISEVNVYLPKFKIDFSLDLNDVLTKLGMGRMFSNEAEFPDILKSGGPLKVSKAVHKAFIQVDEAGIEAAAATGLTFTPLSGWSQPVMEFKADHPFIYALLSQDKGVYFIGKVTNPA